MLKPKKSLSQNFLLDNNICKKIINYINNKDQTIIEIGPGTGQLTKEIINLKPKKLILIEKDDELFYKLTRKYNQKNIFIYNNDILKYDLNKYNPITIISNLPYNISTKIIIHLLINYNNVNQMLFLVQKEVAEKFNYKIIYKNNKYKFFIEAVSKYDIKFDIPNYLFFPKPKVNSTLINIIPKYTHLDKDRLWEFSKMIFRNKRKIITNIMDIKNDLVKKKYIKKRAEDLKTNDLLELFNQI